MAVDTKKPKSRIDLIVEDRDYWHQKEKEIEKSIKKNSNDKDSKEIRLYSEDLLKKFRKQTEFLPRNKLDKATAELIREAEIYLQQAAPEADSDNTSDESRSAKIPKKMMGEVKEKAIDEKGTVVIQTQDNTTVTTPKSTIQRGGFGKSAATAASGEPVPLAGTPTQRQKLDQRVKNLTNQARANQKISRGHSLIRRIIPSNLYAAIARTRRLRKIKKELKTENKDRVNQAALRDVNQINTATGLAASLKMFRDNIRANQEIDKLAAEQGRREIQAINDTHKEIADAVANEKATNRLEDIRRAMPEAGSEEYDYIAQEPTLLDRGAQAGSDPERPALGNNRSDQSPSRPQQTVSSDQDDDDDDNHHRRPRRPRKLRKNLNKLNNIGKSSGRAGFQAAKLAGRVVLAAARTPHGAAIIGIILLIIIIVAILIMLFGAGDEQAKALRDAACRGTQETLKVTLTKTGAPIVRAGEDLTYEITISDTKNVQSLTIIDRLPPEVSVDPATVSSTWPGFTLDGTQRTITWRATPQSLPPGGSLSPPNLTFTLTLRLNPGVDNVHVINRVDVTAAAGGATLTGIPSHGAFSVHTPAEIDQAAALGIRYIIPYGWGTFEQNVNPVDPNGPMGQALQRNNMRAVVDVTNLSFTITPDRTSIGSYIYTCQAGRVVANLNHVTTIVNQAKDSPLTMGYWAKDDDVQACGSMKDATKQVYDHIKSLDPNPEHYVITGYGDINSVQAHYQAGVADAVALYPYPAYLGDAAVDNVTGMVSHIRQVSPQINIIGIYQAFANEPSLPAYVSTKRTIPVRPAASVKTDGEKFLRQGAQSLVAFGWNAQDIHQGPGNVTQISDGVRDVNTIAAAAAPGIPGAGGVGVCDPGAPSTYSGQNVPPSDDDCHGLYRGYMNQLSRIGKSNYGDPTCELAKQDPNGKWFIDKDRILSFMRDDPQGPKLPAREAEGVFTCIIPKECSYNVNAFNPNSTSTSRGTPGAFGCFQMNATGFSNSGQPEDVGDVVWQMQVHNANNWRNAHNGGKWSNYWPQSYAGCLNEYGL